MGDDAKDPDPPDDHRRKTSTVGFVAVLLILLVLYVLSVGPTVAIIERNSLWGNETAMRTFLTFYAPLIWLYKHTPLRAPLDWYLALWIDQHDVRKK